MSTQSVHTKEYTSDAPALDPRRWWVLCVVVLAQFMFVVDVFIVNVAIPAIQQNLHASPGQTQLVIAAYQLAYAVLLITGGRLGDIFGRKRLFLLGFSGFTIASALCGIAPTANILVAARILQGLLAAMMVPQVLAVIQVSFPPHERSAAFGVFGFALGMGSIVGLVLGGILINSNVFGLGWRMIFLVNLPVGIIGLLGALFLLHESRSPAALRLDGIGVGIISVALLLLTYPLVIGRDLGWPWWSIVCLVASLPVFFIFASYERYKSRKDGSPLVELTLFRDTAFVLGLVITFVFYAGIVSFLLILTLYLQTGLHFTALIAGLTTAALGVGFFITSTAAVKVVPRIGGRRVLAIGMAVMALGLLGIWLPVLRAGAELRATDLLVGLFIYGLGEGFVLPTLVNTVLSGIQSRDAGSIAGVFTTMQQISGAIGVVIIGILFFGQLATHANIVSQQLTPPLQQKMQAEGVPNTTIHRATSLFQTCFHAHASESNPAVQPKSCQRLASVSQVSHQTDITVLQVTDQANVQNYANAFGVSIWYNIGLLVITFVLTFWLPRTMPARRLASKQEHMERD